MATLHDAFVDEVRDLFDAEKQLVKALPKLAKNASSDELRSALEEHLEETRNHVSRLEQVFEALGQKPRGKHCAGIAGIIEEGGEVLEQEGDDDVLDAMIIASAQRTEHYEMAAYGTVVAWAEALDMPESARLLQQTLDEEKAADQKLSKLAEQGINQAARAGESDEEEEAETGKSGRGNGRAAGAQAKGRR
ncbi:MAG: ferritin-like domain-containing protein [Vicinamibacterales bacterium]